MAFTSCSDLRVGCLTFRHLTKASYLHNLSNFNYKNTSISRTSEKASAFILNCISSQTISDDYFSNVILQHFEVISTPATNHGVFVTFGEVSDPFQSYHIGFLPSWVILVPNILRCVLKKAELKTRIWMQLSFLWSGRRDWGIREEIG